MSEFTHHLDNNGVFKFNCSHHDTFPTCQGWWILVGIGGMWSMHHLWMLRSWMSVLMVWSRRGCGEVLEDDFILTRMKDEDITPSRARNFIFKFSIRTFCGPLGKVIRQELPDCCLKGVRHFLKNKDQTKSTLAFNQLPNVLNVLDLVVISVF